MREFEIWVEGYSAMEEHSKAHMIGTGTGNDFDEAVKDFMYRNPDSGIEENSRSRYLSTEAFNNRKSNWHIWGCNLYSSEKDARESFG